MLYRGADQRIVANHIEQLAACADGGHLGPTEPAVETVETADPPIVEPEPVASEPTITLPVEVPPVVVRRGPGRPRKVAI